MVASFFFFKIIHGILDLPKSQKHALHMTYHSFNKIKAYNTPIFLKLTNFHHNLQESVSMLNE